MQNQYFQALNLGMFNFCSFLIEIKECGISFQHLLYCVLCFLAKLENIEKNVAQLKNTAEDTNQKVSEMKGQYIFFSFFYEYIRLRTCLENINYAKDATYLVAKKQ